MNVLVACEESQAVCIAFRSRGHRAFSCDIQGGTDKPKLGQLNLFDDMEEIYDS